VKTRAYEMTPFRMSVPAIPRPSEDPLLVDQIRMGGGLSIAGARTLQCTAEGAEREAEEMLKVCRHRVNCGERWALTELLDANPAFIADGWVRRTFGQFVEHGVPLRRRGRRRGDH